MSSQQTLSNRKALIESVIEATYASSTAAVFFHTAVAEQIGLGPTEEKTLLILSGLGPLTAGEIADQTGLTTGSVTNLIDRMEKKGFVRRIRDTKDRRRVIVEVNEDSMAQLYTVFGSMQGSFDDLYDPYSDEQIATIIDYLKRSAQRSQEAVTRLKQSAEIESGE